MKRTMNRLFLRLVMLCVAIILGAIAVAQAQRGLNKAESPALPSVDDMASQTTQPLTSPALEESAYSSNDYAQAPAAFDATNATSDGYTLPEDQFDQGQPTQDSTHDQYGQAYSANDPADSYQDSAYSDHNSAPTGQPDSTAYDNSYGQASAYDNSFDGGDYRQTQSAQYDDSQYGHSSAQDNAYAANDYAMDANQQSMDPSVVPVANEESAYQDDNAFDATAATDQSGYPALPPMNSAPASTADNSFSEHEFSSAPTNDSAPADHGHLPDALPAMARAAANVNQAAIQPQNFGNLMPHDAHQDSAPADVGAAQLRVNTSDDYSNPNGISPNGISPNGFSDGSSIDSTEQMGKGKPGPIELEGIQTPSLTLRKIAPNEIQVGKPVTFQVVVRNVGSNDAHDVLIRDEVPHGTRLIETNPPAGRSSDGALLWQMGTLKAGAESIVKMEVMPLNEGHIGSVATVSFQASASAKAIATKPKLVLEHTGPGKVMVGSNAIFHIKLSNSGSGVATNVSLEEDVPDGLLHTDGRALEYSVGDIRPGETRLLELTLKADKPGQINNTITAHADSNIAVVDACPIEVVAPMLQIGIDGPGRRYLDRKASFELRVENPGTAAAKNLEMVAQLPRGLKFVSTNNAGHYDTQRHRVVWSLAELPAGQMGTVELITLPTDLGDQRIRIESNADMGLTDTAEHNLQVEGLAAILFTVTDKADPIEVNGQTTYEIRIVNQGSKVGSNLRVAALIPDGMVPINGEGPSRASISGQQVHFDALPRLAPQADTLYKIHVKGTTPGDKRIQVQLVSDDVDHPVTKEESTRVYSDH